MVYKNSVFFLFMIHSGGRHETIDTPKQKVEAIKKPGILVLALIFNFHKVHQVRTLEFQL